jgi:flap endonuclease-1
MGVDLGDLAPKEPVSFKTLAGSAIAFDAFNIMYQFVSSIRQEDGTPLMDFSGNMTGHLSGLLYRNTRLISEGIRPIYVFDGEPPEFKKNEIERRREIRKESERKWKEALEYGDMEGARKYAQGASRLTPEMVNEAKDLLSAMGIPWVEAPSEGEAQCAHMCRTGSVNAVGSQDYDVLLFGAPSLVRNLSVGGRRKVPGQDRYVLVEPERIELQKMLETIGVSREQLILAGMLMGNDFYPGVKGIGSKTALKIVKEKINSSEIKEFVKGKYNIEFPEEFDSIVKFFMEPPAKDVPFPGLAAPDAEKITEILVKRHDFSNERVTSATKDLIEARKQGAAQKRMSDWF